MPCRGGGAVRDVSFAYVHLRVEAACFIQPRSVSGFTPGRGPILSIAAFKENDRVAPGLLCG